MKQILVDTAKNILYEEYISLKNIYDNFDEDSFYTAINLLKNANKIIVTGIGKSGIVAKKLVACLNSVTVTSIYLNPQEALHGDIGIVQEDVDVVVMISKSGTTSELLNLIPVFKERNNKIISIVCTKNSKIEQLSDVTLLALIEKEACNLNLVPTSSVIVSLAYGDAIIAALMQLKHFKSDDFLKNHPHGQLGKNLKLKIKDVMYKYEDLPLIDYTSSFKDLLIEMTSKKFGCALITNNNKFVGIITDCDIRKFLQLQNNILQMNEQIKDLNIINYLPTVINNENYKLSDIVHMFVQFKVIPITNKDKTICIGLLDSSQLVS